MLYILLAILFFGFLIAVHEFGHFMTAKLSGRQGERVFHRHGAAAVCKKQGKETVYSLRLLPIGGFCAMEGEDEATDDPRSFAKASSMAAVSHSGGRFGYELPGWGSLFCSAWFSTAKSTAVPTISSFADGCPAYSGGLICRPGDTLL